MCCLADKTGLESLTWAWEQKNVLVYGQVWILIWFFLHPIIDARVCRCCCSNMELRFISSPSYHVHHFICIISSPSFHVHHLMCITSCASFYVHHSMCITSCASFHVHHFMCIISCAFVHAQAQQQDKPSCHGAPLCPLLTAAIKVWPWITRWYLPPCVLLFYYAQPNC
jgi:hypothetical protein